MIKRPNVATLERQIEQIERSLAIIGISLPLPRELPVQELQPEVAAALKAGHIAVRPAP